LLQKGGYFPVDPAALDLVAFQVIDHAERHPHRLPRGGDPGKLREVLAHEIRLEDRLPVADDEIALLRGRLERHVIDVVQHLSDSRRTSKLVAGSHVGEDDVVRHHAEIAVPGINVSFDRRPGALDRHNASQGTGC
jgi:hypothetical protein